MKKLYVVIAIVALSLSGCGRISHDIDIIEDRLDKLEQESIPSINEQIASMQLSLTTLERTSEQLDEYIDGLQTTMEILENSINEANRQIQDLESNISSPDIQGQVNAINTSIKALEGKNAALETTIENLRTEIDAKDNATKDWAEETFATLEQYNSVTAEIASIKKQINTIDAYISNLENQLQDSLADIENSIAALDADLQNAIREITAGYTDAVETAKDEITKAYKNTINESIKDLESSLQKWVGEQLSGYCTISEINAKLEVIEREIQAGVDESLANELTEIKDSLENLKAEVSADYKKAIEEAINTNNGVIDGKIAEALATINSRIDSEVAALDAKITALQSQVNTNTADIAKLMSRIQSVSYIPIYEDDKATVYFTPGFGSYAALDFEIKPNDVVDDIAAAYSEICTVKAIYKQTRAVEFIDMPIKECVADTENGVLSLVVSAENLSEEFFAGTQSASLRLSIANESSNIASEYVPVVAKKEPLPNNEIWYTNGSTKEETAPNKTDVFGANIVSNLYDAEKGCWVITFDGDVTSIGKSAFRDCEAVASVTIPDSVTSIGDYAFHYCSSLTNVTIPNSVTSIGRSAFNYCALLTNVTIPNNVTSIGDYAFRGCNSLTTVTIPDGVTTIGQRAFGSCKSLKTFYGKFASEDNRCLVIDGVLDSFAPAGITSYTIPDGVTSIGEQAFVGSSSLTSVTISNSVVSIGEFAFSSCHSLTSVTIGDSVTSIESGAFSSCSSLKTFYGKFASEDNRCLIVNGELNSFAIGCGATSYTISDSVTSIGEYVFGLCESLTSVTIPDSVTKIGESAFSKCTSLTNITIPNSVTSIGDYAFSGCTSLKEAYCKPTTPPTGGSRMFSYYSNNSYVPIGCKIYVPASDDDSIINAYKAAQYWSDYASYIEEVEPTPANNEIWYTNGSTTKATTPYKTDVFGANIVSNRYDEEKKCWVITFDGDVTSIGNNAFRERTSLTSVTIPDSVTSIGNNAFSTCTSLTSVTIGNGVTMIGNCTFYFCTSLKAFYGKFASEDNRCLIVNGTLHSFAPAGITSYTIPDSVTSIGNAAFYHCTSLTSVTIPNGVTSIGEVAFAYCYSLTSVNIPDSVTSIGERAFDSCTSLKTVYCKPTTPPTGGDSMFYNNAYGRRIFVPTSDDDSIINAYKAKKYWSDYADYIFDMPTNAPVQANVNLSPITTSWIYSKDAAIDAANSGAYARVLDMMVADNTLPSGLTVAQVLDNAPKEVKVTLDGREVDVNANFIFNDRNVCLDIRNFEWNKTYDIEAKYKMADRTEVTVKTKVVTVDRDRRPVVINLDPSTANFKANIQLINNEINDSLDAVYETLVFGNQQHYDISRDAWLEANFIANYTCTNTIVADGVKAAVADQSKSVIKIGNNGKNAFTTFSYADFNFVPAKVEYTKTITTWYGQAVVLNKVINFKFPVYNLKHNTMYVSGSNNSFYTQAQPKYTWMNNNKDEGLLKFDVVVDLRTAFNIVDTGGSMLTADQLVALGLSSEFEIKGTHHEGIEIDQSSGKLFYRGYDSFVNIRGKIVITHNNGAKYAIMPASFNTGGTYESYNVVKFNPVNTATVTKNPTISVNSATAYNVHVLDYISLTDYRNSGPGFSLISNGAWVVGNGTNGFAQGVDVCADDMYRITDTWTMDLSKVDASVRPYISLDNDNGILTFDNTQCGYKGVFSIPVTLTIENCWMAKPQQLTVKVTFYSL